MAVSCEKAGGGLCYSKDMNIIKNNQAERFENSSACTAYEYPQPTDAIDVSRIELSGRYPDAGWAINTACEALVQIVKGGGKLHYVDGEVDLGEGDQVHIPRHERYAFEGTMELIFASTPKWSPEQARHES